ncbi:MAG: cupin domain-containing protein [Patescibacteria group bacterium]
MADDIIKIKPCKKVVTKHLDGTPNGWLLEVQSDRDGFTEVLEGSFYLTVIDPGTVKGYHIHAVATYHVTCLKGRIRSTVYRSRAEKEIVEYGEGDFKTIKYPPGCAHLIENISAEPAYVLIYRYPAWSPDLPEQLDVAPEEIEQEITWEKIQKFVSQFS